MNRRLETITEICVRNELNFWDVMEIYTRYNAKVYLRAYKRNENHQLYNPELEERTMRLTERYFDIKKQKELNKLK